MVCCPLLIPWDLFSFSRHSQYKQQPYMYVILQVIYILCGQMIVNNHTLDFENANVCYMAAPFSLVSPISCSSLTNVYGTLRLN